jgi:hypothetical protein
MERLLIPMLLVLCLLPGVAAAQDDGATVIKEFECFLTPQDSGLPIVLVTQDKTHEVDAVSGNAMLVCHFDIPAGYLPAETMQHSGFSCVTNAGFTHDSWSVTTRGSKAHLFCEVKADAS